MNWNATILSTDGTDLGPWPCDMLPAAGDVIDIGTAPYRVRSRVWNQATRTIFVVVEPSQVVK